MVKWLLLCLCLAQLLLYTYAAITLKADLYSNDTANSGVALFTFDDNYITYSVVHDIPATEIITVTLSNTKRAEQYKSTTLQVKNRLNASDINKKDFLDSAYILSLKYGTNLSLQGPIING
jgi:hypothetical protein